MYVFQVVYVKDYRASVPRGTFREFSDKENVYDFLSMFEDCYIDFKNRIIVVKQLEVLS